MVHSSRNSVDHNSRCPAEALLEHRPAACTMSRTTGDHALRGGGMFPAQAAAARLTMEPDARCRGRWSRNANENVIRRPSQRRIAAATLPRGNRRRGRRHVANDWARWSVPRRERKPWLCRDFPGICRHRPASEERCRETVSTVAPVNRDAPTAADPQQE